MNDSWFSWSNLYPIAVQIFRFAVVLFAGWIAVRIVKKAFSRSKRIILNRMQRRGGESLDERSKRAETLAQILVTTAVVVLWIVTLLMAIREAGFDATPLLASVGIVGLALGFGAQNLVRDITTGAVMLLENQVRVGDVASINGKDGFVERFNLRTITLRGLDGTMHIIPNGAITSVSNMTFEYSYYLFNIGVAYKEDTDRVSQVLVAVASELSREDEYAPLILEPLEILGVDAFAESSVIIKARIKTEPLGQWKVGRELNRRIKKRFEDLGIEFPLPHRALSFAEQSKPLQVQSLDGERANQPLERDKRAAHGDATLT